MRLDSIVRFGQLIGSDWFDKSEAVMPPLSFTLGATEDAVFRAARHSQALVIEVTDRLARDGLDRPRPLGRLWRVNLDLAALLLVGEPAGVVDRVYTQLLRLVTLHREFTSRLFEASDTRDRHSATSRPVGNVIPLARRSGR